MATNSSSPREVELAELQRVILADPSSPAAAEAIGKLSKEERRQMQATLPDRVKAPKLPTQPRKRVKIHNGDSEAEVALKFCRAAVDSIPFAETLWEMMYSFGDSRRSFACSCLKGGDPEASKSSPRAGDTKKNPKFSVRPPRVCSCLEPVKILEEAVRPFIREVVEKAREESEKRSFGTKHLQAIMPAEMCEYMRWRKQRDDSTDPVEAKGSGVGADAGSGGGGGSSSGGQRRVEDEDVPVLQELGADDATAVGVDDFQEAEMQAIMEEMTSADRMILRKEFADARSKKMKTEKYAAFARRRETFFFPNSGTRAKSAQALFREWSGITEPSEKAEGVPVISKTTDRARMRGEMAGAMGPPAAVRATSGGRGRGGRGRGSGRGRDNGRAGRGGAAGAHAAAAAAAAAASPAGGTSRKAAASKDDGGVSGRTLQALAFLAYDRVGMIVETAITRRYGGQLRELPRKKPLGSDEVRSAAVAVRIASEGIGDSGAHCMGAVIPKFRRGLKHRGDPLDWPRNVFKGGQLLVDGGAGAADGGGGGGGSGGSGAAKWQDLDALAAEAQALADAWGF